MVTHFSYSGAYLEELRDEMYSLICGGICVNIERRESCPMEKLCNEIAQIYDATRTAHKLVITVSTEK